MTVFDIVIASFLVLGFISGFMKGLFSEIASLVAVLLGIYVAIHFSYYAEDFLRESILGWNSKTNKIVGYIITFLGVVMLVIFTGKILTKIADITALGLINKVLGGFFGLLKTALIFSIIFVFIDKINAKIPFLTEKVQEESILFGPIKIIAPTIFPSIIEQPNDWKIVFPDAEISI
ncbi:CvpA family protein [Polaribacter sp. BAL334]|uniref:CvpA family protein n=1 Tax=Polaribacter sp. BAL334 TaxID=1708178 RepID=UPI0018D1FC14|nr:CvpA family protein [Polaribacter sp. BAL334]MBG7610929.1 CvpA family protein [Polaribacter sp. BAL334]